MNVKIKNNSSLTVSAFPDTVKAKITTLYVEGCGQINAFALLGAIIDAQESSATKISRVRIDIGTRSGSCSDLMKFSGLNGFDDNYQAQTKPRLVGSYCINTWHTTEQVAAARQAFDGLTVTSDSNYLIDFNDLAVQTLDSTKPNYNPAVAIILKSNNLGITLDAPVISGQTGRWFMTKAQAATISNSYMFTGKQSLVDTVGIVSEPNQSYDFNTFNEFVYFTSYVFRDENQKGEFFNCVKLTEITLPSHITSLDVGTTAGAPFQNCNRLVTVNNIENITAFRSATFSKCWNLKIDHLNDNVTVIPGNCFFQCAHLDMSRLPSSLTTIAKGGNDNAGAFNGSKLLITEIPAGVTSMGGFRDVTIPYLHLLPTTPIDVKNTDTDFNKITKFYVGDGSSAAHDDAIRAAYLAADAGWSAYSAKLDTWYNHLHP